MKKIQLIFLFFLSLTFSSAQNSYVYDRSKVSFGVRRIVSKITEFKRMDEGCVGVGCISTYEYKTFQKLDEKITIPEALELTNHPNAIVRCYSFLCLTRKKYADLQKIIDKHSSDTARVEYISGCIGRDHSVFKMMNMFVDEYKSYTYDQLNGKFVPKTADDYYELSQDVYEEIDHGSKKELRKADKKAKKYLLKAIELDTTKGYFYSSLGTVECGLKNYKASLTDYNIALQKEEAVYADIAWVKACQKKSYEAINYLNKAITDDPSNGEYYLSRAQQRKIIGDTVGYYNDSIVYDQLKIGINGLFQRGANNIDKDPASALQDLDLAISKSDTVNWFYYWYRAKTKNNLGDYTGALSDCDTVLKYEKKFASVKPTIGYALTMQGKYPEALAVYDSIKINSPEYKIIDADIGHVYYLMNDYDTALKYYNSAMDAISNYAPTFEINKLKEEWNCIRGNIYLKKNDLAKACENWNRSQNEESKKALKQYCNQN